jgi:membrane protease YdiL (CAAX protease family)
MAEQGMGTRVKISQATGAVLGWTPLGLPAMLWAGGGLALIAALGLMVYGLLFGMGSVLAAQHLVRSGLVTESGPYQGVRRKTNSKRVVQSGWFRGVVAKELRLLVRDRNFLVQTLVVPVLIIGFQLVINPDLMNAIATNFNHAAMTAFAVGAYVLMFSATHVLTVEGKSVWLLFTFPCDIEQILLRKARLWGVFASIFPMAVLVWSLCRLQTFTYAILLNVVMVVVGLFIYSVIAAGIGVMGTDLFEERVKRKINPAMFYLFMLLSTFYGFAIYAPEVWKKVAMLVLCSLLAYAIWQKVRDHAPFLLDPVQPPPPRLSLSDGLGTALAFFVIQGIAHNILVGPGKVATGPALVFAFAIAGAATAVISLLVLGARNVPNLWEKLGLERRDIGFGRGAAKVFLEGVGFGAVAFGAALLYLWGIENVEALRKMKESLPQLTEMKEEIRVWIAFLAIGIAPFFEEYIFRGLVYKGLRRTWRPRVALLASAAVFAVVHPPISMLPVFVLGLLAAISYERTRLLYTPIVVHAVYNAGVMLVS